MSEPQPYLCRLTPVLFVATRDHLYPKVMSAFAQLRARNGQPIVLCNSEDKDIPADVSTIRVPGTVDVLQGLINSESNSIAGC